jgi:hypothetical protein
VHHRDEPGLRRRALGVEQRLGVQGPSPRGVHSLHLRTHPASHLTQPLTEVAVHADDGQLARLQQAGQARLHAR